MVRGIFYTQLLKTLAPYTRLTGVKLFYVEEKLQTFTLDLALGTDQLKCDGTRAETRFRLSAKLMSPFKSAGASVQSTTVIPRLTSDPAKEFFG